MSEQFDGKLEQFERCGRVLHQMVSIDKNH